MNLQSKKKKIRQKIKPEMCSVDLTLNELKPTEKLLLALLQPIKVDDLANVQVSRYIRFL